MRKLLLAVCAIALLALAVPAHAQNGGYNQNGSGSGGAVNSVFGRSGTVTAHSGDYTCSQVTNCGSGGALPQAYYYTLFPATSSTCLTYSFSGTEFCALNQQTGVIDYKGTDSAVVEQDAAANIVAQTSSCGSFLVKEGDYLINSFYDDTTANIYGGWIVPASISTGVCRWRFLCESADVLAQQSAVQTAGCILDVTSTALATLGSSSDLADAFYSVTSAPSGNMVYIDGFEARFPSNQRGCENGFDFYLANDEDVERDIAIFDQTFTNMSDLPVAGTCGSSGFRTHQANKDNAVYKNVWAMGYDTAFDFETEHTFVDGAYALFSNYAWKYCVTTATSCLGASRIQNFEDSWNVNSGVIGAKIVASSLLSFSGYALEDNNNNYTRSTYFTETAGHTNTAWGNIDFEDIEAGGGSSIQPVASLFPGGTGEKFKQVYNTFGFPTTCSLAGGTSACDAFNRGDGAAGQPWVNNCSSCSDVLTVSSNTLTAPDADVDAAGSFQDRIYSTNQFSQFTMTAVGSGNAGAVTNASLTAGTRTYYECINALGTGKISIFKSVGGSFSTLAATTASSTFADGDIIELTAQGGANAMTLVCYQNGEPVAFAVTGDVLPDGIHVVDASSPITGGAPGVEIYNQTTISNWSGGSLP